MAWFDKATIEDGLKWLEAQPEPQKLYELVLRVHQKAPEMSQDIIELQYYRSGPSYWALMGAAGHKFFMNPKYREEILTEYERKHNINS